MRPTILALLVLGLAAPFSLAEDEEVDPAAALLVKLTELRKAEDVGPLSKAVAEVPEVYKESENKGLKKKQLRWVKKVMKRRPDQDKLAKAMLSDLYYVAESLRTPRGYGLQDKSL